MQIDRMQARFLLVVLGLVILFVAGSIWPEYRRQQLVKTRISTTQARLQEDRIGIGDLPALAQEVGAMERQLAGSPRRVPEDNDVAELLRQLCTLMNEHSLTDQQIVTQPIQNGREYSLMPLRLEFRGQYPEVFGFLHRMEAMTRMVRVTRVDLSRDRSEEQPLVEVMMELSAVFAPPREPQP